MNLNNFGDILESLNLHVPKVLTIEKNIKMLR